MTAPVTVIIGYDMKFYDKLPQLFPHADARSWFVGNEKLSRNDRVSQRNAAGRLSDHWRRARSASIAGRCRASTMRASTRSSLPARASSRTSSARLGYGDPSGVFARSPRLSFDEACQIV